MAGLAVLAGAGLACVGFCQSGRRQWLGAALVGIGGALAAVGLLSDQWGAWFLSRQMDGAPRKPVRNSADCLEKLPEEFLDCGIRRNELILGEHFNATLFKTERGGAYCFFVPQASLVRTCKKYADRMAQEGKVEFKDRRPLEGCFNQESKEDFIDECIEDFAVGCGIGPADLTLNDFVGAIPTLTEDHSGFPACNLLPKPELDRKCKHFQYVIDFQDQIKRYVNPDQPALVRGVDYYDVVVTDKTYSLALSPEMKIVERKLKCALDFEKDLRRHLDPNQGPLLIGHDYGEARLINGKQCDLTLFEEMQKMRNKLTCIKDLKQKHLPLCANQYLDIKDYISMNMDGECNIVMPKEEGKLLMERCGYKRPVENKF